ncbi:MAG: methylated-DNA--[protein]-cysteine S-methyltransferase [Oceanococcus sp.]
MNYTLLDSPIGLLLLTADEQGLRSVHMPNGDKPAQAEAGWSKNASLMQPYCEQLNAYFEGRLKAFDLPLAPQLSAFQSRVIDQLKNIPFGVTRSYGELATILQQPTAARAVGTACGRNPIPIIIPCHRVVGGSGALTGFAGGIERKRWLLRHEGLDV